jgi:cytochrome c oxidase cbb3-type subunit 1
MTAIVASTTGALRPATASRYNEEIVRAFIIATMFWSVAAFTVGV